MAGGVVRVKNWRRAAIGAVLEGRTPYRDSAIPGRLRDAGVCIR